MRSRFFKPSRGSSRTTQGVRLRKVQRPKLSKEARAITRQQRRLSKENFNTAVKGAWSTIEGITNDLATAHAKSLRRVQSELHMGSQLTRKRHGKTNAWNAFLWKVSQEKENSLSYFLVFVV